MPNSANFFATSATQLSDGTYAWINLANINSVSEQSPDNTKPQTTATLAPGETSNTVIFSDFNITYPIGFNITGYQFFITHDSIPIDAIESENVKDFEVFIYKNGVQTGSNISNAEDWTYHFPSYGSPTSFVVPVTREEFEASNFGFSLKVKNTTASAGVIPVFYSVYLNFTYTVSHPVFIYNNDTTSEVNVTLDLNPAVTNADTTFGVFHGDPDTTSPGTNIYHNWGYYYTLPNLNDPNSGTPVYDFVHYANNYINITEVTSTLADHSISYHDAVYDTTDLIAGETYRRGAILFNARSPLLSNLHKAYDTLYFNINVIDTSVVEPPVTPRRRNSGTYYNLII